MSVIGVNHVQVNVPLAALEAAQAFYVGFLGLNVIARPTIFTSAGLWLAAGGFEIHIGLEDGVERDKTRAHIAFEVEDLAAWRRRVEANHWEITEQPKIDGYDRFHFRDPFGNNIELISREAC